MKNEDNFIGREFPQNCGDSLLILSKEEINKYRGIFQKYPYEIIAQGSNIKRGKINNPRIEEEEFINKLWFQNCGDSLKIIQKTTQRKGTNILFECEFIKYPYKVFATKQKIIKGEVLNPLIEENEFIGKIFKQNCGDSVKVLRKTSKQTKEKRFLYEIEYLNLSYKELRTKQEIIGGFCLNPQIEEKFLSNIYPQNCGDSIKILEKTNKKDTNGAFLYKCTFLEYPYIFYTSDKRHILEGAIVNYNYPLNSREAFIKYCEKFSQKPKINNLIEIFGKTRKYWIAKIRLLGVKNYIDKEGSFEEDIIAEYIKSIYFREIIQDTFKELKTREIDIYLPDIKVGFEFNGIYWHSDEIFQKRGYKNAEEYHQEKYNLAKEKGIDLYFIKEEDWLDNKEEVKERIKHIIYEHTR